MWKQGTDLNSIPDLNIDKTVTVNQSGSSFTSSNDEVGDFINSNSNINLSNISKISGSNKQGTVNTFYKDKNGKILKKLSQNGQVGSAYSTSPDENFDGYTLDASNYPKNSNGTFSDNEIDVVYIY